MRILRRTFVVSAAIAAGLLLIALPWEYCMDGTGYGFPFAWYHPGHDEAWCWKVHPEEKFSAVVDPSNLIASLLLWAGMVWLLRRFSWRQIQRKLSDMRNTLR